MEMHGKSFPNEAVLTTLLNLDQRNIVRAQLVSKQWYSVAQLARKEAFLRKWGFSALLAEPRSPTLFETIPVTSIVRRHVVSTGENVPQLALRFLVDPGELMRLNNLIRPHLLLHRHSVYVPVGSRLEEIRGCRAAFEYSSLLCRDLLVAEPPTVNDSSYLTAGAAAAAAAGVDVGVEPAAAMRPVTFNRMMLREMQAHVRRLMREEGGRSGGGGGGGRAIPQSQPPPALDMSAAKYYLREAEGCTERAARLFVTDYIWEQRQAARGSGESDSANDESYDENDTEYGLEGEDAVLVRRMAARARARAQQQQQRVGGRGRRLLRRLLALVEQLVSCGGDGCCCCGGGGGGGGGGRSAGHQSD